MSPPGSGERDRGEGSPTAGAGGTERWRERLVKAHGQEQPRLWRFQDSRVFIVTVHTEHRQSHRCYFSARLIPASSCAPAAPSRLSKCEPPREVQCEVLRAQSTTWSFIPSPASSPSPPARRRLWGAGNSRSASTGLVLVNRKMCGPPHGILSIHDTKRSVTSQ